MTAKPLTLSLNSSMRVLQLIVVVLLLIVIRHVPCSSFMKVFAEVCIKVASFKSEDEVMEDDARADEYDSPFMLFWRRYLYTEFA